MPSFTKVPQPRPRHLGGAASWGIHNVKVIHNSSLQFTGAYQSFSLWGGFLYYLVEFNAVIY